jgi:group II intron reverse transcriptase/maturase
MAYGNLYANEGAMTKGVDPNDTVDGMSVKRIDKIIQKLRERRYQWQPAKRIEIPKENGKKRPLGMAGWSDKLVQEVLRIVLSAYYEPQFSKYSHGFRYMRGCHTALQKISTWHGTRWFIEGDIRGCFDNIDHEILLEIIGRKIKDKSLLKLLRDMLKAGYMQEWKYHDTYSGTPQGSVVSPLLSNIILNELDQFVENELIPQYTKGNSKRRNPQYTRLTMAMAEARQKGKVKEYENLRKQRRQLPSKDTHDPDFRRLKYVRYADDFLLGFIGSRSEAVEIKRKIAQFLRTIKLTMSDEKTLITNATKSRASFLGYQIHIAQANDRLTKNRKQSQCYRRAINGRPIFNIPQDVIDEWSHHFSGNGKIIHRAHLAGSSDYEITLTYGLEFQGLANYYAFAHDISKLYQVKHHYMMSLAKTLAAKHRKDVFWVFRKYKRKSEQGLTSLVVEIPNPHNPDKPLRAQFGNKPLRRNKSAIITDNKAQLYRSYSELIIRLLANECELCGSNEEIEGHHVRKLKEIRKKYQGKVDPPNWVQFMMKRNRKVIFVCHQCHTEIHARKYDSRKVN